MVKKSVTLDISQYNKKKSHKNIKNSKEKQQSITSLHNYLVFFLNSPLISPYDTYGIMTRYKSF